MFSIRERIRNPAMHMKEVMVRMLIDNIRSADVVISGVSSGL